METFVVLMADGAIIPIVLIAAYALLLKVPRGQRLQAYSRILVAGLTAYLVAKLLGAIYPSTERPFEALGLSAGASYLENPGFPSDHMLFATFLTLAVWFETRQKTLTIILIILTLMVGLGRVLALVHTPLDVVGGMTVAMFGALWYLQRDTKKVTGQKSKKAVH
jgi:membrane-associated phospholipid phosphatase